ncbi:DNA adenine methylase [Paenibacillus sp. FSL R5-0623]|uniref:DNA adenine methylase n=1 Tax=Paenibacillus sp. FSL R5-0623 TaxID=2921651 RepID=UPI0030DC3BCD
MKTPRILHYPGSKWSMAEWIINHMPPHTTYLEPFFGSGAVLFTKERSLIETVNDLDGEAVNLFRITENVRKTWHMQSDGLHTRGRNITRVITTLMMTLNVRAVW